MKIEIPKVIVRVDMGTYAEELVGKFLCVWVNLPLRVLREHEGLVNPSTPSAPDGAPPPNASHLGEDERNRKIYEWYAVVWSQDGDVGTHWTVDEIEALNEADPALVTWMIRETWAARFGHVSKKKTS